MPKPIATWNRARDVWETDQASICGHWAAFSETWPTSGMTHSGAAYELPTSAPLMDDSESSLLPTPEAKLATSGPDYARAAREGSGGDDLATATARLLPTPRATDGTKGGPNQRGSSGDLMLPSAVQLLPTPAASMANDGEGTETWLARRERVKQTANNGNGMGMPLTIAVQLLPTPQVTDGNGGPKRLRGDGRTETDHGANLRDVFGGASMTPPSDAGNTSSGVQHQHQPSPEPVADSDSRPALWNG